MNGEETTWFLGSNENKVSNKVYKSQGSEWTDHTYPSDVEEYNVIDKVTSNDDVYVLFQDPENKTSHRLFCLHEQDGWQEYPIPELVKRNRSIKIGANAQGPWVFARRQGLFHLETNQEWKKVNDSENWD